MRDGEPGRFTRSAPSPLSAAHATPYCGNSVAPPSLFGFTFSRETKLDVNHGRRELSVCLVLGQRISDVVWGRRSHSRGRGSASLNYYSLRLVAVFCVAHGCEDCLWKQQEDKRKHHEVWFAEWIETQGETFPGSV